MPDYDPACKLIPTPRREALRHGYPADAGPAVEHFASSHSLDKAPAVSSGHIYTNL